MASKLKIVAYLTATIDDLAEGDWVISRDQDDSEGPLVASRITRKYRRVADHLELVGTEDAAGERQTLKTTDEHPFYVAGRGWTKSKLLELGDRLSGPAEAGSSVTTNARQSHPEGVVVYNMEVEGTHSYFVRAEGSMAEPVWVHNASYDDALVNELKWQRDGSVHDSIRPPASQKTCPGRLLQGRPIPHTSMSFLDTAIGSIASAEIPHSGVNGSRLPTKFLAFARCAPARSSCVPIKSIL